MRFVIASLVLLVGGGRAGEARPAHAAAIELPPPDTIGRVSLERTLRARRSRREFGRGGLTFETVGQLLWAAQGVTGPAGRRTAPSAGGLAPLEVYLVSGDVRGLSPGVHRYDHDAHGLVPLRDGDLRAALGKATAGQDDLLRAPATLVIAAVDRRVTEKYGAPGRSYVHMEVGSVAQNVYLQAEALGLATVQMGAFDADAVRRALGLPAEHRPLALMPVGRRR
jgi:SagB-type dehydrogenase family enzyme